MKKSIKAIYTAIDGKEFTNKDECLKHEAVLKADEENTLYYSVVHSPDLTEGRGYQNLTLLTLDKRVSYLTEEMVEDFCYKTFGPKVAYVMGVQEMSNWILRKIPNLTEYAVMKKSYTQCGDYKSLAVCKTLIRGEREIGLIYG